MTRVRLQEAWEEGSDLLNSAALSKALAGAVHGAFAKPERHAAALKLVHGCWQVTKGKQHLPAVNPAALGKSLTSAVAATPSAKVSSAFQTREQLA